MRAAMVEPSVSRGPAEAFGAEGGGEGLGAVLKGEAYDAGRGAEELAKSWWGGMRAKPSEEGSRAAAQAMAWRRAVLALPLGPSKMTSSPRWSSAGAGMSISAASKGPIWSSSIGRCASGGM